MTKIKNIRITDFRIYTGQQDFNFEISQGGIANLMVIYAPNGFGKTSFFDAVEWCYSSKIRRFEGPILGGEVERREYSSGNKILLTNRKSHEKGLIGNVVITTADNRQISRSANDRKITNSLYRHDYRFNQEISEFNSDTLQKLVRTNILTQDQIDEFLRHTAPDQRFNQLKNFWPEGDKAVTILQKIDSYLTAVKNQKTDLENNIAEARNIIADYLNADEQIAPINTAIKEIVENSILDIKIEPLSEQVNQQTYDSILSLIQSYIEKAKLRILDSKDAITKIGSLHSELPDYLQWLTERTAIAKYLVQLGELEKSYADLQSLIKSQSAESTNLARIQGEQQKLTKLVSSYDLVQKLYADERDLRQAMRSAHEKIDRYLGNVRGYNASKVSLQQYYDEVQREHTQLDQRLAIWDKELDNYRYWSVEQDKLLLKIQQQKLALKEKEDEMASESAIRSELQEILRSRQYDNLPDIMKVDLAGAMDSREKLSKLVEDATNSITELEATLARNNSLEETLGNLLEWAGQYVKDTDASHCPVCASGFKDASALLTKIEAQKSQESNAPSLKRQIDGAHATHKALVDSLNENETIIQDYIQDKVVFLGETYATLQQQKDSISSEIVTNERQLDNAMLSAKSSRLHLLDNRQEELDEAEPDFESFKSEMHLRLQRLADISARMSTILQGKTELILSAENVISTLRNDNATAKNKLDIILEDETLIEAEQLLEDLDILPESFSKELLDQRQKAVTSDITNLKTLLEDIGGKKNAAELLIANHALKIEQADVAGVRIEKENEAKTNAAHLDTFESRVKTLSEAPEYTDPFFTQQMKIRTDENALLETELTRLEALFVNLKVIEKNVNRNLQQDNIIKWNSEVAALEKSLIKIAEARQTAEEYINREIQHHFSEDVINQIYSRIEPHPDLNHIKINPKVTPSGPILEIKAISSNEELDPSLYLSAGQLNVLSLSIFLAKAFEVNNDEIGTIFMDDPIQNLSDINVLSFIDLIRTMITKYDRQIVISSHDENFYKLMRNKMPSDAFPVKYYEIKNFGQASFIQ